jgi:hypothetical protein
LLQARSTLDTVPAPSGGVTVRNTFYGARVETVEIPERDIDPGYDDQYQDYDDAVLFPV